MLSEESTSTLDGATSPISVDRSNIKGSTFYEILAADGGDYDALDTRLPLEVSYFGEGEKILVELSILNALKISSYIRNKSNSPE